jgi:hypothetical protein
MPREEKRRSATDPSAATGNNRYLVREVKNRFQE